MRIVRVTYGVCRVSWSSRIGITLWENTRRFVYRPGGVGHRRDAETTFMQRSSALPGALDLLRVLDPAVLVPHGSGNILVPPPRVVSVGIDYPDGFEDDLRVRVVQQRDQQGDRISVIKDLNCLNPKEVVARALRQPEQEVPVLVTADPKPRALTRIGATSPNDANDPLQRLR